MHRCVNALRAPTTIADFGLPNAEAQGSKLKAQRTKRTPLLAKEPWDQIFILDFLVCLVYLVSLVFLVCLVYLVFLVS